MSFLRKEGEKERVQKYKKGVIFVIHKNGEIVVQERLNPQKSYYGYKIIPGGKIEEGESIIDALFREVKEEGGIEVLSTEYLGSIKVKTESGNRYEHHIHLVKKYSGELQRNREPDSELYFVPLERAKEICKHPVSQKVIDMALDVLSWEDR